MTAATTTQLATGTARPQEAGLGRGVEQRVGPVLPPLTAAGADQDLRQPGPAQPEQGVGVGVAFQHGQRGLAGVGTQHQMSVGSGKVLLMIDHISLQTDDFAAAVAWYDAVLAPLGFQRLMDFGVVAGYGPPGGIPAFWLGTATDAGGRQTHVAFTAADRDAVHAFHQVAVGLGSEVLHEPRVWPEYHPDYYGVFVRDPDGNNVEAVCHRPAG